MTIKDAFNKQIRTIRWALLLLAGLVIVTRLLPMPGLDGVAGYAPLHLLLETMAIVVAAMVFILGWNSFRTKPDFRLLMLSAMFCGVAILDFMHMISVNGMPALITPSGVEKGINYWLAARFFAAIALFSVAFLPHRIPTNADRYIVPSAVVLVLFLINLWFLVFPDTVPATFIEGKGLTQTKILAEFVVISIYAAAGFMLWRRAVSKQQSETLMLACAAIVMALSEVFFTFYAVAGDIYNLVGHVYKIIAYSFLFRAIVLSGINEPFREVEKLNNRIRATLDALPDMMFEMSSDGTIHDYHSHAAEGELVAPPQMFLGRNMREFLPNTAIAVFLKAMLQIANTGRAKGLRYSLMMPTGEHWFELSGAGLEYPGAEQRYVMVVRDVTDRYLTELRTQKMLALVAESVDMDDQTLARKAIDLAEALTSSKIGFLHMVNQDQQTIELLAWSTVTGEQFCHAEYNNHYPVDEAGIWADCIRFKKPVVVNNYELAGNKRGMPEGHARLERFISVPIMEGDLAKLIMGVGNSNFDYTEEAVNTVQLIGNELYQIIQRRRAQRDAERSQRILKAALDNLPLGVAINSVGSDVHFEYMNNNFPRFYRTTRDALINSSNFWEVVYEDAQQREKMQARVISDFESGDPERMRWSDIPLPRAGQELRYITAQNVMVPEEGLSVSLVMDVTESLRAQSELRIAATAFASQEGIMITDAQRNILRINQSFEKSSGFTQLEVQGLTPALFRSGRQGREFYEAMWDRIAKTDTWTGEVWNRRKNGEIYPQTLTITAVRNEAGEITNYVGDYVDLTELKHAEQEISKLSYFDSLTGLPNREKFLMQLRDSVALAAASGRYAALLMIDLDHFKDVNDTLGHGAGDALLVNVAERLQRLMRPEDSVARFGGDEFVMILNALDNDSGKAASIIQKISQSILAALDGNYAVADGNCYITCSIGTTLYGPDGADSAELLKQADIALYKAKDAGRDQVGFFDPAWQAAISERAKWLTDLREGINKHQFELYLQAQQDEAGHVIGAEALVRWNHPVRGLVSPAEFIPLAEETGLILPLGKEIMRMGLDMLKRWSTVPRHQTLKLSINVSPQQFYEAEFAQKLAQQISDLDLDAGHVMLEFTESTLIDNVEQAQQIMAYLSELGVQFAIDDFGTGYSSLAYLSELPLHQLKIDQSFVRNMGERKKDRAIVKTIIDMAHTLGMQVLAEGVETELQRDALLAQGCPFFQGYLISRPLPILGFEAFVDSQNDQAAV
ncbi:MAG: EAL domain-containing protein [Pseudohongiella sp.]|nr:EAL domain-containing protein [Pseudohongiella sp.]